MSFDEVIAVDGPSGSGKSTVCRRVAAALGAHYLDTGAMYRAVTAAVLRAGVDIADDEAIAAIASDVTLTSTTDPAGPTISINGERVDAEIRGSAVTGAVSAVAAVAAVRKLLVDQQRLIVTAARADAGEHAGGRQGIVVEGRDIGTVVAPDAVVKIYLTASAAVRAARRHAEIGVGGQADTQLDLTRRDELDASRALDPLTLAPDAVVVDTTELGIDEAVAQVLSLVHEKLEAS